MLRVVRSLAALIAVAMLSGGAAVYGQQVGHAQSNRRRLDEALADLQRRGLKIIYSSEVVRPDMRVETESRDTSLRRTLDELLSPHGLIAQDGPGGTVLIVKNPRARLQKRSTPQTAQPVPTGAGDDGAEPPRFEDTIDVIDVEPRVATGPPPFVAAPTGGPGPCGRLREHLPNAPGAPRRCRHRRAWQPDRGSRWQSRSEPDGHGRHRDPQPIPAHVPVRRPGDGRTRQHLQSGHHRELRVLPGRIRRAARRSPLVAPRCEESRGIGGRRLPGLLVAEPRGCERDSGGKAATPRDRILAGQRTPVPSRPRSPSA